MAVNILTPMPPRAGRRGRDVELVELRVLDGPNRFFTRPAVKLEFAGTEPGNAAHVAEAAGRAVQRLSVELGLREPRLARRESVDGLRSAIAYPWRRRTISQSIGASASRLALGRSSSKREIAGLRATALGPLSHLPRPRIPIVAVTGTNGKSTTTRLIAHVCAAAGRQVGMTNSDGIYVRGELVEAGDWTGFGGAARILSEHGLDVAILETARGGILLRGIGYASNDISVVTNVSADHLGLQGIDTVDELADVKSTIVRITKRDGWAVLNADDPRAWAMRRATRAKVYAFSLDGRTAEVRRALRYGGRAATLENGWIVLHGATKRPRKLLEAADLPVTFAGLSVHNIANALAGAAACDALGLTTRQIKAGLRTFAVDRSANPGRLNLFERKGVFALVDFAHNEAGLSGLLDVAGAVAGRHQVRLGYGTAGDRTDEILHNLGVLAAARGRSRHRREAPLPARPRPRGMNAILRDGAREGGFSGEIEAYPTELSAMQALVARARPGDVCALMAHVERKELFEWLESEGFEPVDTGRLRQVIGA